MSLIKEFKKYEGVMNFSALLLTAFVLAIGAYYNYQSYQLQLPDIVPPLYLCGLTPFYNGNIIPAYYYSTLQFSNEGHTVGQIILNITSGNVDVTTAPTPAVSFVIPPEGNFTYTLKVKPVSDNQSFAYTIEAKTTNGCRVITCTYRTPSNVTYNRPQSGAWGSC